MNACDAKKKEVRVRLNIESPARNDCHANKISKSLFIGYLIVVNNEIIF